TVSVHVSNVLGKLGLSSRTQAALYAARIGLLAPDEPA
ncbi:MAG: LuxR C-terminal-related transcriptional regulator, partial [Roseiflexaceae bacterium]